MCKRHLTINSQYHFTVYLLRRSLSLSTLLYSPPSLFHLFFPSPPISLTLLSSLLPPFPQGLYEYAKPAWQERPRPQVDEGKVKNFGQNVAPRPLNPAEKQLQLYPVAMEINGVEAPRYSFSLFLSSRFLHSSCAVFLHSFPPSISPIFSSFSSSLSASTAP